MERFAGSNRIEIREYVPVAVYYEDADNLEYVINDVPSVYRRIDELLTLIVSMDRRDPIGFRLKGFKNFYLRHIKPKYQDQDDAFLTLVKLIEEAMSIAGDAVFLENKVRSAYESARSMADRVGNTSIFDEIRKLG